MIQVVNKITVFCEIFIVITNYKNNINSNTNSILGTYFVL